MKRMSRARVGFASTAAVAVAALVFGGVTAAYAEEVTAVDAVAQIAPEVLENAATGSWTEGAAIEYSNPESVTAEIPTNPQDPITIADGLLSIELPNATEADNATTHDDTVVTFDNNDGSTTVPVAKEDGSIQIATVIENSQAPTRYDYEIGTPGGSFLELQDDGSVIVVEDDGTVAATIAAPWAKDASGAAVPTRYEVDGSTLTQVVDHDSDGVAYPVVADPTIFYCTIGGWYPAQCIKLTKTETKNAANAISAGVAGTAAITSHFCGRIANVVVRVACIGAAAATAWLQIKHPDGGGAGKVCAVQVQLPLHCAAG